MFKREKKPKPIFFKRKLFQLNKTNLNLSMKFKINVIDVWNLTQFEWQITHTHTNITRNLDITFSPFFVFLFFWLERFDFINWNMLRNTKQINDFFKWKKSNLIRNRCFFPLFQINQTSKRKKTLNGSARVNI